MERKHEIVAMMLSHPTWEREVVDGHTHGMDLWKCSSIVYIEANVTMRSRMRESRTYGSVRG